MKEETKIETVRTRILELEKKLKDRGHRIAELEKTNTTLRGILDNAPLGIFHFDQSGTLTSCNDAFVNIMGSSRNLLLGLKLLELPDRRIVQAIRQTLDGFDARFEGDYRSVTGEKTSTIRLLINPVHAGENVVDGGIGIVEDISERKAAQEDLEESFRRFREMAEDLPEVIYETDLDGTLTFVNQKAFELFGYTREEFEAGLNVAALLSDRDRARAFENIAAIICGENVGLSEYELVKKDGSTFSGMLHSAVILRQGTPVGLRGFLMDMTEEKRTQELLAQTEKMMSIGGLAAGLAHEINNPLAGMMQNVQVIQQRIAYDLPANVAAARAAGISMVGLKKYMEIRGVFSQLDTIMSAGKHAAAIVMNMLSFSRKSETRKFPHDLEDLVERTLKILESVYGLTRHFDIKSARIVRDFEADVPPVECHADKIQQVIFNIIKNSADAMEGSLQKGTGLEIGLKIASEKSHVRLEIKDNGPGMDEKTRNRIFEPFFTTKESGKGTGLGLSVSYFIIVEDHGGTISVSSEPGCGARFIIRLPYH